MFYFCLVLADNEIVAHTQSYFLLVQFNSSIIRW